MVKLQDSLNWTKSYGGSMLIKLAIANYHQAQPELKLPW